MYIKILLIFTTGIVGLCGADPDPPPTFSGKDVTHTLLGDKIHEDFFPAAFGDFNADKLTDIFTVSKNRSTIAVYLAREEEPLFIRQSACDIRVNDDKGHPTLGVTIKGVSLGDFNGDGMLDVMITLKQPATHGCVEIQIFAGNGTHIDCFHPLNPLIEMYQEPLIVDVDGDMIMDLIGESQTCSKNKSNPVRNDRNGTTSKRVKTVWKFLPGKQIQCKSYTISIDDSMNADLWTILEEAEYDKDKVEITKPSSNAIVDIDQDTVPELIVTTFRMKTASDKSTYPLYFLESYRNMGETLKNEWHLQLFDVIPLQDSVKPPPQVHVVGQPIFIDLNQDGNLLHILPYCTSNSCKNSKFKVISWRSRNLTDLDVSFEDEAGEQWSFLRLNENGTTWFDLYSKPGLVYRVGDYNMDGYPDLIGVIMTVKGSYLSKQYRAVIFENVPCVSPNPTKPCPYPRTFRIDFKSLATFENVTMATFFDIYDDGLIDVLLVRRTNTETHLGKDHYSLAGFLSNPDYDANYLKVEVTSGRACPQCRLDGIPYGNIIPGPIVSYNATTQEGEDKCAIAAQMYRSAHLPLDLPYIIFGIGHSPNFIDVLDVSWSPSKSNKKNNKWTQLIPNSQIIVIAPYPPSDWKGIIFLPSTKAPLHTFLVLLGFCGIVGIIALILQWRERREDRKERLLETHRFMM